jgi:hypothetical protein
LRFDDDSFFCAKAIPSSPPITPRPVTPQRNTETDALEKALVQLSVSPSKRNLKQKKRKADRRPSVIAPVFQIPELAVHINTNNKKWVCSTYKSCGLPSLICFCKQKLDATGALSSPTPHIFLKDTSSHHGRPRLGILDRLTVKLPTQRNEPRKYRCTGKGCLKMYKPRSRDRVLMHAKTCMKLTIDERKMAAAASAETAPSALVAEIQSQLASSPTVAMINALTAETRNDLGEGQVVVVQSSSPITASTPIPVDKIAFFGPGGRRCLHRALDLAVVKLICVARLPPSLDEWKELFALQTPSYHPASRTKLMENQIMSEQEHVRKSQIAILETKDRLSLSFDGGSIRSGESLYTVHATTAEERRAMLLEGQECTSVSHTGAWIAELVLRVRSHHYIL